MILIEIGDDSRPGNRSGQFSLPPLPMPQSAAEAYGTIRADLESRGQLMGNNDLWIAAHAVSEGLTLITNNEKELRRVQGLKVQNWAA